jgi:hypothetical protein
MKCTPLLAICTLTFLPTQVEGFLILRALGKLLCIAFYPERRNDRDCESLYQSAGVTGVETCTCQGWCRSGVDFQCPDMKENICFSPFDAAYCSNETYYYAETIRRPYLTFFNSPQLEREIIVKTFNKVGYIADSFTFIFVHAYDISPSKTYISCTVQIQKTDLSTAFCDRCTICDNGVDFKYDCSNIDLLPVFDNVTNTTTVAPYPKVDSCFPVADIIPSY